MRKMDGRSSNRSLDSQSLSNMSASTSFRSRWMDFPSFSNSVVHTSVPSGTVDQLLGRDLSAPPSHFTRILYIPRHDHRVTHLPLYDVSGDYERAVRDAPMGSSKHKINLSLMRRPSGDRPEDEVRYLLDVYDGSTARLQRRSEGTAGEDTAFSLPRRDTMTFTIDSPTKAGVARSTATVSFPMADQRTPSGTIRFPYLNVCSGNGRGQRLQWQIQPHEHGSLRYTLVDTTDDYDPIVKAIYHHVGLGINLPSSYSEGVLLLPPDEEAHDENLAVASLLALLWHVRALHTKKETRFLKRLLGRL